MGKQSKRKNRKNRDKSWRHQLPKMPKMPEFVRLPMCEGDPCTCPPMADSVISAYRQSVDFFIEDISVACLGTPGKMKFETVPEDGLAVLMGQVVVSDAKTARKLAIRFAKGTGGDGSEPLHNEYGSFSEGTVGFSPPDTPDMPRWAWEWSVHFTTEKMLDKFIAS